MKTYILSTLIFWSNCVLAGGFVEGTLIRISSGSYIPIESVKEGDTVVSCQEGKCKFGKVTGVLEPDEAPTVFVLTDKNQLTAAEDQTFMVDSEWVEARSLKIGDIIAGQEKVTKVVKGIEELVYGFEVDTYHNFFANSCLAHNMPYGLGKGPYGQAQSIGKTDMSNLPNEPAVQVIKEYGAAAAEGCFDLAAPEYVISKIVNTGLNPIVPCAGGAVYGVGKKIVKDSIEYSQSYKSKNRGDKDKNKEGTITVYGPDGEEA